MCVKVHFIEFGKIDKSNFKQVIANLQLFVLQPPPPQPGYANQPGQYPPSSVGGPSPPPPGASGEYLPAPVPESQPPHMAPGSLPGQGYLPPASRPQPQPGYQNSATLSNNFSNMHLQVFFFFFCYLSHSYICCCSFSFGSR